MKTKAYAIFATIALVILVNLVDAQQQTQKEGPPPEPGSGNSAITAKLEQIVDIRQRILKNHELLVQAGWAADGMSAAIELAEARIELALEGGQREEILKEITGLVAVHEQHLKRLQSLSADRLRPEEIDRAKASLLQAEVRLLKAQR